MAIFSFKKLALAMITTLFIACNSHADRKNTVNKAIQLKLDSITRLINAPGANLSIILTNGDSLTFSSGFADIERAIPMKQSNKMLSGSIGKTYVAAIAFQLIQSERLKLTDKVIDLLKDEKWISRIPNINELNVDMLLAHTSGLPRYEFYNGVWNEIKSNPDMVWSVYDRMKYILDAKPLNLAGKSWDYSDSNYILIGAIIEKITGKEYYDSFRTLISNQKDLKNTVPANQRQIKGLASGYTGFLTQYGFPEKMVENEIVLLNPQMEWCGGGVASTATDIARWAKHLYEGDVISTESVIKMVTPSIFETDLPDGQKYGYATIISAYKGDPFFGHTGFFPGYRSIVQYSPKYKFSIALQINRDNPNTKQSLNQLIEPIKELVILYVEKSN
ncbi:MAG: class A beta-lactamase-related serine hydrolase [Bacteroidales bacterium]|nr:MAG: class A beta-lactamase-related serine hydrolase [Bacteroidales bacterium]